MEYTTVQASDEEEAYRMTTMNGGAYPVNREYGGMLEYKLVNVDRVVDL